MRSPTRDNATVILQYLLIMLQYRIYIYIYIYIYITTVSVIQFVIVANCINVI